jgi:preprotein translocase subunit SecD
VAPPAKSVPHPGRALAALGVLIVVMLLGILGGNLFSPGHWHKDFKINLGLDLSSGTQVTMKATTLSGGIPTSADMNSAVTIITNRVNGTGNSGAEVQTQGNQDLVVSVPGKAPQQTENLVSTTALLMFRQALLYLPYGTTTTPTAKASATPSATPSGATPSASTGASPPASTKPTVTPSPNATSTAKTTAKIVSDASPTPSATPSASAPATASPSPSPSASSTGAASTAPATSVTEASGDASMVNKQTQALFNKLVCKPNESPSTWKAQIGYTTKEYDNPNQQIVACDSSGNKYVLDVAKVQGQQVTSAAAQYSTTDDEWQVVLSFNSSGASAFGALTQDVYNKYYSGAQSGNADDEILNQVAIVLDGTVVSSDSIDAVITGGQVQIYGTTITQAYADQLQEDLQYGSLPLAFTIEDVSSVSAQLGHAQLNGGLVAAGIGLLLVVLYAFFYYRGLALVSMSSLGIAAVIGYLGIVLLSKYQNFTLDLTGIAGLIVAIGITADSFVVYFERLRDEVREGKQLRPAVEAGWKRARRTILVSDTVTFLAALLLYYFSIGDVKGFAFTLGLTTLIDVLVVFSFTKPMMTLIARRKFFSSGNRWSGLDPARLGARTPWRSSVRRNPARARTATSARTTTGEA